MKNLIFAVQFLTILPLRSRASFDHLGAVAWYPVVGLLLGVVLAGFDWLASQWWQPATVAVLDVVLLAWLSGALHLDGLGDTADGLYGQRPLEKALAIMKDSRLGTMGMVVIALVLAVKGAGISELDNNRALLLIMIPAYARSSIVFGVKLLPYGRPGGGTALGLFDHPLPWTSFMAILLPVSASLLLGWSAIWINLGFLVLVVGLIQFYRHKLGCITGDMLGALVETCEAGLFLVAAIGG